MFHAKKKNLPCSLPSQKNLPRTQELKRDSIFTTLLFTWWALVFSIQVAVANRYKWNTYLFHQRNGEAQKSQVAFRLRIWRGSQTSPAVGDPKTGFKLEKWDCCRFASQDIGPRICKPQVHQKNSRVWLKISTRHKSIVLIERNLMFSNMKTI